MGLLISAIRGKNPDQVFVDFENAKPSSEEQAIYDRVQQVLIEATSVLTLLDTYKGSQELVRTAMSTPTLENEQAAFESLLEGANSVAIFFNFSKKIEAITPELLMALSRGTSEENKQSFSDQQALVKQFAELLNFALSFDQLRMSRPSISNDFSYYRRLLPKFSKHTAVQVKDEDASVIGLFTAEHIPMTSAIAKAAEQTQGKNASVNNALVLMSNSCYHMCSEHSFTRQDIHLFCARAMVGAIVCFDHVCNETQGVFTKRSGVHIKPVIKLLKKDFPNEQSLINAIRYSTKHFKEADEKTQALFD